MRAFSGRAKNHKCTNRSGGMMATATFDHRESRLDRYFFPGLALLMLATVFWGFARSYFLAGVFKAPLPNWLIHLHGAAFTSWILLLIAQTTLVSAHRVDVHRKLGLAGFGLACLMVVLGISASTDSLRRSFGAGATAAGELDPKTFYIIPRADMLIFGTLVLLAFRTRSNPPAHKRLVLVATTALMLAAVARWPIPYPASSFVGGRVVYLRIPGAVAGLRLVHHRKSPSRDDLGQRLPDRRAARQGTPGRNGCMARFRYLGAEPGQNDSRMKPNVPFLSSLFV